MCTAALPRMLAAGCCGVVGWSPSCAEPFHPLFKMMPGELQAAPHFWFPRAQSDRGAGRQASRCAQMATPTTCPGSLQETILTTSCVSPVVCHNSLRRHLLPQAVEHSLKQHHPRMACGWMWAPLEIQQQTVETACQGQQSEPTCRRPPCCPPRLRQQNVLQTAGCCSQVAAVFPGQVSTASRLMPGAAAAPAAAASIRHREALHPSRS